MVARGHEVTFFERDVPYYAQARDLTELPAGGELVLYSDFGEVEARARGLLDGADLAMTTSYCPDGRAAAAWIVESGAAIRAFYDLDTPVTLDAMDRGTVPEYVPEGGLGAFDLVLSYTGGRAVEELRSRLGARGEVVPWYGSVDPERHFPVEGQGWLRSTMSYLGTYAADRQAGVERLLLGTAERMPGEHFLIGGAQYPETFPWAENIGFVSHMPPALHPAFFCSSRATLNVTREAMARYGYCPSGRLFEAAACGVPVISDEWEGLGTFFAEGTEILPVREAGEVVEILRWPEERLRAAGAAARERALRDHTGEARVRELEAVCARVLATRGVAAKVG